MFLFPPKAAWNKWQRDPLQYACKAYCTARQELNILLSLRHQNIVPLVGVCTRPLALVLQLAPMGALDSILKNYRRSGAKLDVYVLQRIIFQVILQKKCNILVVILNVFLIYYYSCCNL